MVYYIAENTDDYILIQLSNSGFVKIPKITIQDETKLNSTIIRLNEEREVIKEMPAENLSLNLQNFIRANDLFPSFK